MRTGPTNEHLVKLIASLRIQKKGLWKRVADELARPTRQRRAVNLSRINAFTGEKETALVLGKVLGSGVLDKKLKVAGWQFSESATAKIKSAGGEALSVEELLKQNPEGRNVRLIG